MKILNRTRLSLGLAVALLAACAGSPTIETAAPLAADPAPALPLESTHGVPGVGEAQLTPEFWIRRLADGERQVLDRAAIDAQNARLLQTDDSMHDLGTLPEAMSRQAVLDHIQGLSTRPENPRYDESGAPVPDRTLDALLAALDLGAIPASQAVRYGLVVRRAALRSFPTDLRVFSSQGDTDIDRFQESALFPGTPVAIIHRSRDRKWLFVISPRYAAWIEADHVAIGTRAAVTQYVERSQQGRVVTGAKVSTVHTREEPRVSEVQLDMGVRVPLAATAPDTPVNGQHPYAAWAIELPVRNADGSLAFAPALLQRNTDTRADVLPLTHANLIGQAFKFLGERYGWGHSYNGRDCSGFVSEIYQSMGVLLPRNTSDQAVSPALNHTVYKTATVAERRAAVDSLQVGDLVYIPGHVMMMIGRIDGRPYVIHDTNGGSFLDADGQLRSRHLNGVSVTPLEPLRFNADDSYIDRITSIVRIRP